MDRQNNVFQVNEDLLSMFLNTDNRSQLGGLSSYEDDHMREELQSPFHQQTYQPFYSQIHPNIDGGFAGEIGQQMYNPGPKQETLSFNLNPQYQYEYQQPYTNQPSQQKSSLQDPMNNYYQNDNQNQAIQQSNGGSGKGNRRKNKETTKHVAFKEEVKKPHKVKQEKQQNKKNTSNGALVQTVNQNESMDEDDEDSVSFSDDSNHDEKSKDDPKDKKKTRKSRGGTSTDSRQRRLEKNRESARESRKRKKNYIQSLEAKVETLESEVNRLRHIISNQREKEKLSYFSHLNSMDQLLSGRQILYERLEQSINQNKEVSDMENIINSLNIRMGSFGIERKNLINNLFKSIVEVSVPNYVRYLFWGSAINKGIFDDYNQEQLAELVEKRKRLSKYQLEELKNQGFQNEWEEINSLLQLTPEQHKVIKEEQLKILEQKEKFQSIINDLIEKKKEIFVESAHMDQCLQRLRQCLTTEQTAKFLVLIERFKSKEELNMFKLWGIKKIGKKNKQEQQQQKENDYDNADSDEGLPESEIEETSHEQSQRTQQAMNKKSDYLLN